MRITSCLVAASSILAASCGCNDIGCGSGIELTVPAEIQSLRVTLPSGAQSLCPSETAGGCTVTPRDDGTRLFALSLTPTARLRVAAMDGANATVFDGDVSLTLRERNIGPDACDPSCPYAEGTLVPLR